MEQKKNPAGRKRLVSVDKMTKKQRREFYAAQRSGWGGLAPVTRVRPSGKVYDRRAEKRLLRDGG